MISLFVVSGVVQERAVALAGIEQYIAALNLCFLIYGDPRGRGAHGTPIMLFICWRTGIISRAMDRILDAELADEIFDATLFSLESQQITEYQNLYKCYSDFQFMPPKISKPSEIDISNYAAKMYISDTDEEVGQVYRTSKCLGHPFSHWTVHRHFIKSVESNKSVSSLVQMSLIRNKGLEEWLLNNLPLASKRSTPVLTESIQYSASISVAVFTQHLERLEKQAGYQSPSARLEEAVNPLCRLISRERFALNCVNLEGACYSWGSNNMGQLGSVASAEEPSPLINTRPFLLYNPRPLLSLKDILIREVACGYSHTLAIAESGVLLAWGSNRHFQLGIGPDYPDTVMSAVPVKIAVAVRSVSCGSEHSLALTHDGQVYSWGQGEGGLLGLDHFDSCHTPQHVMAMSHVAVDSIVCGGLHNLALTDRGQLWSWGRGEGGQLGVKRELLIQTKDGELYQNKPYLIEAFSRTRVTQIAAGDAHSLALEIGGLAYAWGFSTSGQLGTGAFSHDHSLTGPGTQQFEPALVKLPQDKPIMKVKGVYTRYSLERPSRSFKTATMRSMHVVQITLVKSDCRLE